MPTVSAISVDSVRCTITLSMIACVMSGMPSAKSWMASDATSTSRQTAL